MVQEIISHSFNSIIVAQRSTDGYINLTAMCKACGKQLGHYLENASTKAFLEALSSDTGRSISELIQIVKGGFPELQGTFGHPSIASNLREWLNRRASQKTLCEMPLFST